MAASIISYSIFSSALAITVSILSLSTFSLIEASNGGFSLDLIHRDSPKSPFYNHSLTHSQRMANALERSRNRVGHVTSTSTDIIPAVAEYLVKISIGTPPVEALAMVDTGSDLLWLQCEPCKNCFKQYYPLFNPKTSSTFKAVSCSSNTCQTLEKTSCEGNDGSCPYSIYYVDKSYSLGFLATDTVTLGSTSGRPVPLPNIIFGCGVDNEGTILSLDGCGIIGLGGGAFSFISQLGSSIGGKFSYCLVPSNPQVSGKLNFGENGVVSGTGVVSTPLVWQPSVISYRLTLEGISVGNERLDFYNSPFSQEGNIIIDSGFTMTLLPSYVYLRLESAVKKVVPLEPVSVPEQLLCYKAGEGVNFPIITAHFKGANVRLRQAFFSYNENVVCFVIEKAQNDNYSVFGNLAQRNLLVGYDLQAKTVSFKDC